MVQVDLGAGQVGGRRQQGLGLALQVSQGIGLQFGDGQPQLQGLGATQAVVSDHRAGHLGIGHRDVGAILQPQADRAHPHRHHGPIDLAGFGGANCALITHLELPIQKQAEAIGDIANQLLSAKGNCQGRYGRQGQDGYRGQSKAAGPLHQHRDGGRQANHPDDREQLASPLAARADSKCVTGTLAAPVSMG